jgi:hypothetical protein
MDFKKLSNPPVLYRSAPFWSWNDKLDENELKRQIDEMVDKGWGSFFMHSRVGLVTGYLSDEWMDLIRKCTAYAKEKGVYAWLYDEDKWPSGFAGGIIPEKNEVYRGRALILLPKESITENDTVLKEVDGEFGKVYVCKRISPLDSLWFNGASYVDLMNPKVTQEFINSTHEAYKKECGDSFGKEIPGIFTDEPCYIMGNQYDNFPIVPWSECLPDFFMNLKGYDICSHVEQLFLDTGDYRKIRFDFYDAATRLFLESFSKVYYNWCDKNNLKLTGHYMCEDNMIFQTRWVGAAMPHYEFMHWPGIDKLERHIEQHVTVKQLTSVADQLGKERTLSEVFGCIGQQSSFFHRKWITDWQAVLGINFVNSHLSLYSMRGERKRDYPANLFIQQPWWEDERCFADYTARVSYAVSQGEREVDILVLHPISSVWSEFSPLHSTYNAGEFTVKGYNYIENTEYDEPFDRLSYLLTANKLDFHYGDEIIMENHARVEGKKLIIGRCTYSTIVVPPILAIRTNTLRLLNEFAKVAGDENVIFVGKEPSRLDGNKQPILLPKNAIRVKSVQSAIQALDHKYNKRISIIDESSGKNAEKVICHVRKVENGRLVFAANTDDSREIKIRMSIPEEKKPVLFDPMSGEFYEIPYSVENSRVFINCTLHSAGSMLVVFTDEKIETTEVPAYLPTGIEFNPGYQLVKSAANWDIHIPGENVMPLHNVTLYVEGKKVLDNQNLVFGIHNIFNKLKNGTPIKLEYKFNAKSLPNSEITAVVEVAENYEKILLNDHEVKPLKSYGEQSAFNKDISWKDVNFTRIPLNDFVVEGCNTLVLEGKKVNNITGPGVHERVKNFKEHYPTEIEAVYIIGDFRVTGDMATGLYIENTDKECLINDLTRCGYPFYADKAEFTQSIHLDSVPKKALLKIRDVHAATLRLYVNKQFVDVGYIKPFLFDISRFLKAGNNEIKVVASTTLFNLMGPNWISDIETRTGVSPDTFIDFKHFTNEYTLLPFGIGEVLLLEVK